MAKPVITDEEYVSEITTFGTWKSWLIAKLTEIITYIYDYINPNIFIPTLATDFTSPSADNAGKIWEIRNNITIDANCDFSTSCPNVIFAEGGGVVDFGSYDVTFNNANFKFNSVNNVLDLSASTVNSASTFAHGYLTSFNFGATGDGVTDDTNALQNCLDIIGYAGGGVLTNTAGTYMINAVVADGLNGLMVRSNTDILNKPNSIFQVITNGEDEYSVFAFISVENVSIEGGTLIGDRDTHTETTGEKGFGIRLGMCDHASIINVNVQDMWGDGFFIGDWGAIIDGETNKSTDVYMLNCVADNNRRQGMSLVSVQGMLVDKCIFKNTNGTSPEAGMDSEPNPGKPINKNVTFLRCEFDNNVGGGITCPYGDGTYGFTFKDCVFTQGQSIIGVINFVSNYDNNFIEDSVIEGSVSAAQNVKFSNCNITVDDDICPSNLYAIGGTEDTPFTIDDCRINVGGTRRGVLFYGSTKESSRKIMRNTKVMSTNAAGSGIFCNIQGYSTIDNCQFLNADSATGSLYLSMNPDGDIIKLINSTGDTLLELAGKYAEYHSVDNVNTGDAVADTANDVSATYSQSEVQAIITEMRAIKTSLQDKNILG